MGPARSGGTGLQGLRALRARKAKAALCAAIKRCNTLADLSNSPKLDIVYSI